MKDQENNPAKRNQNKTVQKPQTETQRNSPNQQWNQTTETAKKANQNWDEREKENIQSAKNPKGSVTKTQNQPQTRTTTDQRTSAGGANPQLKPGTVSPQSKQVSNYTGNPQNPKR